MWGEGSTLKLGFGEVLISVLHDGDESGTLKADTRLSHTNSARRRQWKHSGRLKTLDLTKMPSRDFWIFLDFCKKK